MGEERSGRPVRRGSEFTLAQLLEMFALATREAGGAETIFPTGACVMENATHVHRGGNASPEIERHQATFLLPKGAPPTIFEDPAAQAPPGQAILARVSLPGTPIPGPLQMYQSMTEYAPGVSVATQTRPGWGYTVVLQGQVTRRVFGAAPGERVYNPGEGFVEDPDEPQTLANTAPGMTVLVSTRLLPKGPQQAILPAAAPAATGGASDIVAVTLTAVARALGIAPAP
jgi:hypothetical protein